MNKTIVAAFLGAVFASTAVLPTFNVHAANGGLISEQTVVHPIRSLMEAQNLALDFVEKRWDKHPQWQSGHLGDVVSLVNSAGKVQAYEVQISDQYLQPIGYVIVEAGLSGAIVAEYACEGYSPSQLLVQAYEKQTGKNIGNSKREMQMLYSGPGTSGMAWVNENNERQFIALNPSQTASGYRTDRSLHVKTVASHDKSLQSPTVKSAAIDWSFKPFFQEFRTWENARSTERTCYAGCTPVAAAMLIDFYDRNGYPNMIGDDTQQDHHASSALMRETIDSLRGHLRTYCREDGQGGTAQKDSVNLVKYMNERGEQQWKARRVSYAPMSTFSYLIKEIRAQRPVIVHFNTRGTVGTNHSAIAFGYDYGGYWGDNFLTVRTGWSRAEQKYYNIESMGSVEATLVSKD